MGENYKNLSLSGLPLKTGLRKFLKQKGNDQRSNIRASGKKKEEWKEQRYGYIY